MHSEVEGGNVIYKAIDRVWWIDPVQQLSTTQLLTCPAPVGQGREKEEQSENTCGSR